MNDQRFRIRQFFLVKSLARETIRDVASKVTEGCGSDSRPFYFFGGRLANGMMSFNRCIELYKHLTHSTCLRSFNLGSFRFIRRV